MISNKLNLKIDFVVFVDTLDFVSLCLMLNCSHLLQAIFVFAQIVYRIDLFSEP
jgi:hypothetical protein